jgi:hypothetical protein
MPSGWCSQNLFFDSHFYDIARAARDYEGRQGAPFSASFHQMNCQQQSSQDHVGTEAA